MPTSNESEIAISSFIESMGVHKAPPEPDGVGLDIEEFPGVGVGSNGWEPTSRSTTCATIKQMTAKLPVTWQQQPSVSVVNNLLNQGHSDFF